MALFTSQLRRLRIAPRKVRLVTDAIKGREVEDAFEALHIIVKRGAHPIEKLLKSAVANVRHNAKVPASETLTIKDIRVDEGPVYKRSLPRAHGRASRIRKKTSHITLTLEAKK
ncbi:MAG: 50S ribosomal protein L22 [Patescibacteria group bacterium]